MIGITCDVVDGRCAANSAYAQCVAAAGAAPVLLPTLPEMVGAYLELCHGFMLTGGDDPIMERWGITTHPNAKPIDPQRQAFELALLDALSEREDVPVLGICLGMQLMGLHAGGQLDQYLPESAPTAAAHWGRVPHSVSGELGCGTVLSHHRQALTDPGHLRITATAPDDMIEAISDPDRPFYIGVQWHPEQTGEEPLGHGLIRRFVNAAQRRTSDRG